mgnify:CR=1 FL=1
MDLSTKKEWKLFQQNMITIINFPMGERWCRKQFPAPSWESVGNDKRGTVVRSNVLHSIRAPIKGKFQIKASG